MAVVKPILDAAELGDPYYLDWTDHPQIGPWRRPRDVTPSNAIYRFQQADIEIDVTGPKNTVSRCSALFFGTGFALGEGVLLGDNLAGRMPVHLIFRTPMRSIGARVSADGPVGCRYLGQCSVRLDDGQWYSVPPQLSTLRAADANVASAPMMGAIAGRNRTITEVWFDVIDPENQADFRQVAIGDLLFLAA